jgi:copper chaperone CopZ
MKFKTTMATLLFSMVAATSFANETTKSGKKTCTYDVKGMTCASCAVTLKAGVKKLDGINTVKASVGKKNAIVSFDPKKTDEKMIEQAIDKIGYEATLKQCKS